MKASRVSVLVVLSLMLVLSAMPVSAGTGNLAPPGPHYNLNLIGVPRNKTASMDNNGGHRIFVPLWGTAKIYLVQGEPFTVLDANGTDGNGAKFQLPSPDPDNDGVTTYSVWARALGKPLGEAAMKTCATDTGGTLWCSVAAYVLTLNSTTRPSKFTNVSKYLLYIYVDLDGNGTAERYSIFSSALQDYFWNYDNSGLKLVQLRFYEIPTNVN